MEALQLLQALKGLTTHARTHPACIMWENHPAGLCAYGVSAARYYCGLRKSDGTPYSDTTADQMCELFEPDDSDLPWWFGKERFHIAHRQTLLSKNLNYYRKFFPNDRPFYGYWWPKP